MTWTDRDLQWRPDVLGGNYVQATLPLEPDDEGECVATLVRYRPRRWKFTQQRRAVLYVHGWNDYFFQEELAEFWHRQGVAFYALDLRKYGRSLREHQTKGFITDLAHYDEEISLALDHIRAIHSDRVQITGMGHSTGGLIWALWAERHPSTLSSLILNSPWLELQGSWVLRTIATPMIGQLARLNPRAEIPLLDPGFSARTMLEEHGGEWNYDKKWRPSPMFPVRAGWLRAIMRGHAEVADGLGIDVPVLTMVSARSLIRPRWSEEMRRADIILDVDHIVERAAYLGPRVTLLRVDGGLHDVVMSAPPVRAWVYREMRRWARAYT